MKSFKMATVVALTSICLFSCEDAFKGVDIEYYTADEYQSVSSKLDIPNEIVNYKLDFPSYSSAFPPNISGSLATLGRVLFYDENLSETSEVSCASCHKQEIAFSDDVAFSEGINGHQTKRNSLALGSVFNFRVYYGGNNGIPFMWDNSLLTASDQARAALESPEEMGMDGETMVARVQSEEFYKVLFEKAYGDNNVTHDKLIDAIAEFVNAMGSFDSKFDHAIEDHFDGRFFDDSQLSTENITGLTVAENEGLNIYVQNCSSCHSASLGRPVTEAENNGLYEVYPDKGMGESNDYGASYDGLFKVPTLRNIAVTGPYMHDGIFNTLEEVVEHYSTGVKNHSNLSYELRDNNGEPLKMNFDESEKVALIAFLNTLTDETFINNPKYSNPFK